MAARLALALLALLALAAGLTSWQLREVLFSVRAIDSPVDEPVSIAMQEPTKTSRYKYDEEGNQTLCITFCQGEDESWEDFLARVARQWKQACEALGE